MARVPRTVVDPKDPQSLVEHLRRVQTEVDGRIEVGSPQDPNDPSSTTIAAGGASGHNGTLVNVLGSWVEVDVTAANTVFDCRHNLNVQVIQIGGVNQPNVTVFSASFKHDGNTVDAASTLSVNYDTRDAANISSDSFPLRLYVGGARTIAGHAVRVRLFFTPGVR